MDALVALRRPSPLAGGDRRPCGAHRARRRRDRPASGAAVGRRALRRRRGAHGAHRARGLRARRRLRDADRGRHRCAGADGRTPRRRRRRARRRRPGRRGLARRRTARDARAAERGLGLRRRTLDARRRPRPVAARPRRRRRAGRTGPRSDGGDLRRVPAHGRAHRGRDVRAARTRAAFRPAAAEGRAAQRAVRRRRVRGRRARVAGGPRLRAHRRRPRHRRHHDVGAVGDLRVPLRAVDGLRGLHPQPHAGGVRRDRRHRRGGDPRTRSDRPPRDERGAHPLPRVRRARRRAQHRDQDPRHRPGCGDPAGRDRGPGAGRPGAGDAVRPLELVAAREGARAGRRRCRRRPCSPSSPAARAAGG